MKIRNLFITLLVGIVYFYLYLPAINLTSLSFWFFITVLTVTYVILHNITGTISIVQKSRIPSGFLKDQLFILIPLGFFGIIMIINFVLSPLFIAKTYSKRIDVVDSDFITDIRPVDFNSLPVIDRDSSMKLGDRVMGQMSDLVSQFTVSDLYTQINYKGEIVRVTPLEYSDFFKVLTNSKDGIKGYISVNSVTGEANLTRLDKGMKYMPSAILGKDLKRKLRMSYPTKIFGEMNFEIDEEGNPYWVVSTIKYYGVNIRADIEGAIILNPVTGESNYYDVDKIPSWVDHVYSSSLVLEQVDDWGKYKNGFLNSIFGQKNVVVTTAGYNYTALNDDIYLYTGITSVISDESNIGFIMTNLRTKETKFYAIPGAEEFSAMSSAEGQVQQMKYSATFPLLINVNSKPTYFMSLKDNAGLVKMFAFVDVADYQKVVVTDSKDGIEKAIKNYIGNDVVVNEDLIYEDIVISSINTGIIDGNSIYYITSSSDKYKVNLKVNEALLPFLNVGDSITVGYSEKTDLTIIMEIKK